MKKLAQIALSLAVLFGASALSACGGSSGYSEAGFRDGYTTGGFTYPTGSLQNGYGYTNTEVNCIGDRCTGDMGPTYYYNDQSPYGKPVVNNNERAMHDQNIQPASNQGGWFSGSKDNRGQYLNTSNEQGSNQGGWFSNVRDNKDLRDQNLNQPASNQGGWFSGSRDNQNLNQPASNQEGWFSGSRDNRENQEYYNTNNQGYDNQPANQGWFSNTRSDNQAPANNEELARRVRAALENSHIQSARTIQVTSDNGTVTLRGFVITTADKDNAESAAKNVNGVRGVSNKLSIQNQNAPMNQ